MRMTPVASHSLHWQEAGSRSLNPDVPVGNGNFLTGALTATPNAHPTVCLVAAPNALLISALTGASLSAADAQQPGRESQPTRTEESPVALPPFTLLSPHFSHWVFFLKTSPLGS